MTITDDTPTPPDVETIEPVEDVLVYASSLANQFYCNIYRTVNEPADAPANYGILASVHHLLTVDPFPTVSERPESASHYGVRGALSVTKTDDEEMLLQTIEGRDGRKYEAFGSRENFSAGVQETVDTEGVTTMDDVWGLFTTLRPSAFAETPSPVHFMLITAVEPDEYDGK